MPCTPPSSREREALHCVALLVHLVQQRRGHLDDFAISLNRGLPEPAASVRVRPSSESDPFTGCSHAARLLSLLAALRG